MLGATYDYVHRLLDFSLKNEKEEELEAWRDSFVQSHAQNEYVTLSDTAPRVLDLLRAEGLLEDVEEDTSEPCDVTMEKLPLPEAGRAELSEAKQQADMLWQQADGREGGA